MKKMTIGRTRKKSIAETPAENREAVSRRTADAVMIFGAATVCGMLALPMISEPVRAKPIPQEAAVMVMSRAVGTQSAKEEVIAPSNAEDEEWNFYDYIGELFAGLISGR